MTTASASRQVALFITCRAGLYRVKYPEISGCMVADKAGDIRHTGATTVLGGDRPRSVNLITGPSHTAGVEQTVRPRRAWPAQPARAMG